MWGSTSNEVMEDSNRSRTARTWCSAMASRWAAPGANFTQRAAMDVRRLATTWARSMYDTSIDDHQPRSVLVCSAHLQCGTSSVSQQSEWENSGLSLQKVG